MGEVIAFIPRQQLQYFDLRKPAEPEPSLADRLDSLTAEILARRAAERWPPSSPPSKPIKPRLRLLYFDLREPKGAV